MTSPSIWRRIAASPWSANVLSLLAFVTYLVQAIYYAHNQESLLDEGAYVYKGYLFASGQYVPYQPYGPWSNQMPLSFLIPGLAQVLLGPGLRTARYFAIFLALLMLIGLWVLARRFGGNWWAALTITALALSPAMIKTYSLAVSQGLVACMLVWSVVCVLVEQRSTWQILSGTLLAGLMLMTRINMASVLPILVIFVFWRYGPRMGFLAALAGLLPIVFFHAIYWPDIMRRWADWLPRSFTPFLDLWRYTDIGGPIWVNSLPLSDRWWSFLQGLKSYYLMFVGLIGFSLLWFFPKGWKTKFYLQAAACLGLITLSLLILHAWASLLLNYCVFCFEGYLAFFAPLGLVLIPLTYQGWKMQNAGWFNWFIAGVLIILWTSLGYGSYRQTGSILSALPFPRMKGGQILSGTTPLWSILEGVFGIEPALSKWVLPTLAGLILSIISLFLIWLIWRSKGFKTGHFISHGFLIVTVMLIIGLALSPTVVLAGSNQDRDCQGDVIASYESVGRHLASLIPPGSFVYWEGGLSVVPLLYLPGIKIYPAQINDGYSYRNGGDSEELLRVGLWNSELQTRWLSEADFIIVEQFRYTDSIDYWDNILEPDRFQELEISPSYLPCRETRLRVFQRIEQ